MTKDVIIKMTALVHSRLGNIPHQEVEEIVQKSMIKVLQHYNESQPASMLTYAYLVVKSQIVAHHKKEKEHKMALSFNNIVGGTDTAGFGDDLDILLGDTIPSEVNVELEYERKEQVEILLNSLNNDDRLFIELYFFQGCTFEEMAEIYGLSGKPSSFERLQSILKKLKIIAKKT